jgi:hypothetical protein
VSAAGHARRIYEAAQRSGWDAYRTITFKQDSERITKMSSGAIAAARAGDVTRLDPMIAGPEGGPSSDMQRFED